LVFLTRRLFIASSANGRLKAVRRLVRSGSTDLFVAEGARALRAALAARARIDEIYASPDLYLGAEDALLVANAERLGTRVLEIDAGAFRTLERRARPDGILALVERPHTALARLELRPRALLAVAVAIERPGNLGTIVRTACAAGAEGLVVADPCTDPFHRDVVRGSAGTIFHVPIATATSEQALAWLRMHSVQIVAATPDGATPYRSARYDDAVAVVLGNERHGLPEAWLAAADDAVAIPMEPPADSLNVGVAAGILLFEARHRRAVEQPHVAATG
jgi:TrmH family RNA methyltransferase